MVAYESIRHVVEKMSITKWSQNKMLHLFEPTLFTSGLWWLKQSVAPCSLSAALPLKLPLHHSVVPRGHLACSSCSRLFFLKGSSSVRLYGACFRVNMSWSTHQKMDWSLLSLSLMHTQTYTRINTHMHTSSQFLFHISLRVSLTELHEGFIRVLITQIETVHPSHFVVTLSYHCVWSLVCSWFFVSFYIDWEVI